MYQIDAGLISVISLSNSLYWAQTTYRILNLHALAMVALPSTFVELSQCDKVEEQHRGYVLSVAGIMCS